jgi:cell wall-associated NlpC family hydrolase
VSVAASQADVAAQLLERLLAEPDFRARFRRDPAAACREAGLDELAEEMSLGAGKAMMTLDVRESKSSLAGVLMAAAMEGVGLYELSEHVLPHLDDIPAEVGDVLSRVNLPSIRGALANGPDAPATPPVEPSGGSADAVDANGPAGAAQTPVAPPEGAPPDTPSPREPSEPPADAPVGRVSSAPVDPSQLGAEGTGGTPTPETRALLANQNVVFDPDGVADLEAGRIDPRVVAVLTKLSQDHKITVSCMCSDHSKFTTGGSVSNHHFGRGVDIAAIDGVPVNPSNFDAREIAMKLQDLDPSIRPNEIGTPWAITGPGYFTDSGHQDHLHIGFKDELAPSFTPPADLAAPDGAQVKPGDTLAFAAPRLAQAAEQKRAGTLSFSAVADQPRRASPVEVPDLGPTAYPGDDAPREQIAAWMAAEAQKRGLPPELPVMASLVESGMKNLNYGDRDSVGFFQMRTEIWNSGPYAGYPDDPDKQLDWFLDHAEAVKAKRLAAGQPIDDPNQYGNWVADVERPAEQYRGRYQLRLAEAQELLKNAPQGPPPVDDVVAAPQAPAAPVDPGQFGAEGMGGPPSPETEALLKNSNVVFDSTGIADLKAGRIDPRVVAVLTKLSQDHKITVSCMCSDHSKFTSGGSVSNHHFGRGVDIAAIDGVPVNPSNFDAREIAMKLQDLDPLVRPNEIGTPWAISGPGYFTDGAHQNHLHIGFKEQITPDWKPPADLAAAAPQAVAPSTSGDTLTFAAPREAKAAADARADTFQMAAVEPAAAGKIGTRGYPGDDASQAAIAAWMAAEAQKRGLPPELPVMASLVESGMKNLDYGDRDSVGFFQMRTEIWNNGPYEGYPDDPQKQLDWFLDHAEAVKDKRLAAGQSIDDPNQYGNWVADVELPAEQYRGRYQLKLAEAQDLLKQAPPADVAADAIAPAAGGGAGARALAAVAEARKYLGTPYQWGGSTPETNFDCSGLVQWSYAQAGIQIPRVTYDQIDAPNGKPVGRDELLPGDLVFFADGGDVHHVGMSLGGDKFIHAPHTGDVVKISSLNESYYAEQFAGGRRFDRAGAAPAVDPTEVAKAQAHVALGAAEVRRHESLLFKAVRAQEAAKSRATVQFLKAIDPDQAKQAAAAAQPPELTADAPPLDLAGVSRDYPGDDASQAELAKWLAGQAEKAGLPPELPVMAALVESGVKNLNFGDADSVGFFQMRTTIWNSGPYAGYPERPELQAKWFIDNALAVKRKRIAAGDVNFGKDPAKWGEWIADVERPAEQYRGRYQLRLSEARGLLR